MSKEPVELRKGKSAKTELVEARKASSALVPNSGIVVHTGVIAAQQMPTVGRIANVPSVLALRKSSQHHPRGIHPSLPNRRSLQTAFAVVKRRTLVLAHNSDHAARFGASAALQATVVDPGASHNMEPVTSGLMQQSVPMVLVEAESNGPAQDPNGDHVVPNLVIAGIQMRTVEQDVNPSSALATDCPPSPRL